MMPNRTLLLEALRTPSLLAGADARCWEQVIGLSRRHGLAGRWHALMDECGALDDLNADVRAQLGADARIAERRRRAMAWETRCAAQALRDLEIPVVLLKGAAYLATGLPNARSRMSADLDILVPHTALADVEAACRAHGWRSQVSEAYDDAYFRRWMHELPPMQHVSRGTVIDIHHNILPLSSRLCPDAALLLERAVPNDSSGLYVLQPVDMLLHSIVHGFYDGEFLNALRDVLDVYEIADFYTTRDTDFFDAVVERSLTLGFARPVLQALDAASRYFDLRVPTSCRTQLARAAGTMPLKPVVDWSIDQVMFPRTPAGIRDRLAARLLQARSHVHKMPPMTLARHLGYKTWRRLQRRRET